MSEYLQKFKNRHSGYFKRGRDIIMSGDWHMRRVKDFDKKEDSFKAENGAVYQMVKRLSVFISGAKGDRHLASVQKYITEIVEIINIHLDRIDKYYERNVPTKIHKQNSKIIREQEFQQFIFNGEIKISEELDKLNINNDYDNLKVEFFGKRIASIPFKPIVELYSFDIKTKVDSLGIDWDVTPQNRFFINIPDKEKPSYNPLKHFLNKIKVPYNSM